MFKKPSDPRSGSYEQRLAAWEALVPLAGQTHTTLQHLTAKEAREALYEARRVANLLERIHSIRIEQSNP